MAFLESARWDARACGGALGFEKASKMVLGSGALLRRRSQAEPEFHRFAGVLNRHLEGCKWLIGDVRSSPIFQSVRGWPCRNRFRVTPLPCVTGPDNSGRSGARLAPSGTMHRRLVLRCSLRAAILLPLRLHASGTRPSACDRFRRVAQRVEDHRRNAQAIVRLVDCVDLG